jgi:hypothetical protein
MTNRLGIAFFSVLACAAVACSANKTDSVDTDGGSRSDSRAADTGIFSPEAGRTDGQGIETARPDAPAADEPGEDAPAQPAPDGRPLDGQPPSQDGQAPDSANDLAGDRPPAESGGSSPDTRLASDGTDGAIPVPTDSHPNEFDGSATTDGGDLSNDADAIVDSLLPATPDATSDTGPAQCGRIKCDCTYKGKKLWGKVQYVDSFPDFKVKISSFPDLNVHETSFATRCGEWEKVTAFGDFKVQIVDFFEDFDIAYSSFPGIP